MTISAKLLLGLVISLSNTGKANDELNQRLARLTSHDIRNLHVFELREVTSALIELSRNFPAALPHLIKHHTALQQRAAAKRRPSDLLLGCIYESEHYVHTQVGIQPSAFLFLLESISSDDANERLTLGDLFTDETIIQSLRQAPASYYLDIAASQDGEAALFALFVYSELMVKGLYGNDTAAKKRAQGLFESKFKSFGHLPFGTLADPQLLILTALSLNKPLEHIKVWKSPFEHVRKKLELAYERYNDEVRPLTAANLQSDVAFLSGLTDALRHTAVLQPQNNKALLSAYQLDLLMLVDFAEQYVVKIAMDHPRSPLIQQCVYTFYAVSAFVMHKNSAVVIPPKRSSEITDFRAAFGHIGPMAHVGLWLDQFHEYTSPGLILRRIHVAMISPELAEEEHRSLFRQAQLHLKSGPISRSKCANEFVIEPRHNPQ